MTDIIKIPMANPAYDNRKLVKCVAKYLRQQRTVGNDDIGVQTAIAIFVVGRCRNRPEIVSSSSPKPPEGAVGISLVSVIVPEV